jgi:BirA family biotin operon repressor/biotin-[acetyl-CoA-carboxylase] ligase
MSEGILELLRRHRGQWLVMEALQAALDLKPVQIHEEIDLLRGMGHEIEVLPARGFRLVGWVEELSSELIEYGLGSRRIGKKVLVYDETDSTNDVAWHWAAEAGYDGLAVFAERQRAGRGRLGRQWEAPRGSSILGSVLLQGENEVSGQVLTLLVGLATASAIEKSCGVKVRIKWPNDVTIEGRKVAGTMVEARRGGQRCDFVVGAGINCQQDEEDFAPELRASAISLRQETGGQVDRLQLAQELLRQMDEWLIEVEERGVRKLHDEWLGRYDDMGRRITLLSNNQHFEGRVIEICPEKGLLLQLDSGGVKVFDGATTSVAGR